MSSEKPVVSADKEIQSIVGTMKYQHLFKPDTKYNKEGIYSITVENLSEEAVSWLTERGIKPRADGSYAFKTKYKPEVNIGRDQWAEDAYDEDVLMGRGTEVIVSGTVWKSAEGKQSFKPFKVVVTKLIEYVPDGEGLKPL